MLITSISLKNWRNFKSLDCEMGSRLIVVGANATGKSNLLDAFRFLRDIAAPEGGLAAALTRRGGLSKVRCLHSGNHNHGRMDIDLGLRDDGGTWLYHLSLRSEARGHHRALVHAERVVRNGDVILDRPDSRDCEDQERLTQTALEQISENQRFRVIANHLARIRYLHLVPQIIRNPSVFRKEGLEDPFGSDFIARINATPKKTRDAWLNRIQAALKNAVPQFENLEIATDEHGIPHLHAGFRHFGKSPAIQDEQEFSDGTLRLLGLLWALVELPKEGMLLLEEPELSLNSEVIKVLPSVLTGSQRPQAASQVILTTHSMDLLADEGVLTKEVLLLKAEDDGTKGRILADDPLIRSEVEEAGLTIPEAIAGLLRPGNVEQLPLFGR
jgi:predicted ATPase